jgi:hypothetical protein
LSKLLLYLTPLISSTLTSRAGVFSVYPTPRRHLGRGFILSVHCARIQQPLWRIVSATVTALPPRQWSFSIDISYLDWA